MRVRAFDLVAASALALLGSMPGCSASSVTSDDDGESLGGTSAASGTSGTAGTSGNGGTAQGGGSGSLNMGGVIGIPQGGGPPAGGVGTGGLFGDCEDPDFNGSNDPFHSLKTQSSATGTNGTFEDYCDENDNLIEQVCEITCSAGPPPGTGGTAPDTNARIVCFQWATGRVSESLFDCGGRCVDGSCFHWCPTPGDTLTIVGIDGPEVRFRSVSDNEYRCTTYAPAAHNCTLAVDRELVVSRTSACGLDRVLMGLEDPSTPPGEDCLYECTWE